MGPDNLGGKTTSIVYNVNNRNEVYIGSMGGGVFYTWNKGISWHQVGENLMVSCMVQAEDGTIYVGTGDCGAAATYNGMSDLAYDNSFIGSGLYKIKNNVMSRIESTIPTTENDVDAWSFINDIALVGNKIVVATSEGLKFSADGTTWSYAKVDDADLTGIAMEVKVASDETVVASVDGMIYIGTFNGNSLVMECRSSDSTNDEMDTTNVILKIASAPSGGLLDIAVAPSDANVLYAATISAAGNHNKFYISEDQGATWRIILPSVTNDNYQIYEDNGLYYNGLVVNPNDPYSLLVTGKNIWRLERPVTNPNGYYLAVKVSSSYNLHIGINAFAYDPRDARKAYVATDGGIYKAEAEGSYFSFVDCNRGYVSTRCFNVAPTGNATRVVAGLLEHGPIIIEGLENTNTLGTASLLLPTLTPAHYGAFDESECAGACAVSLVNPEIFFFTTKEGVIYRTESAGVDYDQSNFTSSQSFSFSGYRMPMALWETFDDQNSVEKVWFKCDRDYHSGENIQCFSNNCGYPFYYKLHQDLHFNEADPNASDSLLVADPITTKMYVAASEGTTYTVFYTLDANKFNIETTWFRLVNNLEGMPTCITVSADGDVLFVGHADGKLTRISNLNAAVDAYTSHPDSAGFAPVSAVIQLPVDGQCVTSVSILSEDNNKVVVTLGNYGNDSYVMYSGNALADAPTFTAKQGNLHKMPVYSSVYTIYQEKDAQGGVTKDEEHVLVGTEHGVYRCKRISSSSPTWEFVGDNMGDVPVLELKQQKVSHPDQIVATVIDDTTYETVYPGVSNKGTIYAATYGRGLFRCETYHTQYTPYSVPEVSAVESKSAINMYPNPVSNGEAKISFELNADATVTYQVFDMTGRMVKSEALGHFSKGSNEAEVSMEGLANGAYVLRLNAGNHASSVKFLVL